MKKWLIVFLLFFLFPGSVSASENKFITIVNPIRISSYSVDPELSLKTQYESLKQRDLVATWLFTYDAYSHNGINEAAAQFDLNQEKGVFLEVTPKLAADAGVEYVKTDSWHRANSLFLSGYSQSDRVKLIQAIFNKFQERNGKFPTAVGGWWIDSYSLKYMREKYGITSVLTCSDQFSTDGYQIWGQYFSVPFYTSVQHAGVPAQSLETKLGTVSIQWAMRDPLNGYLTPTSHRASLYSTQDYFTIGLDESYLEKLTAVYLDNPQNKFGQITFGLEGDFLPGAYESGNYISEIDLAQKLQRIGVKVVTMSKFSSWYSANFKDLSPSHIIETDDSLGTPRKAVWYQSPYYRAGFVIDKLKNKVEIVDLRFYSNLYIEPYYQIKNSYHDLEINIPSLIDSVSNKNEKVVIENYQDDVAENSTKILNFGSNKHIILKPEKIIYQGFQESEIPEILKSEFSNVPDSNEFVLDKSRDFSKWEFTYISMNLLPYITLKKILFVTGVLIVAFLVFFYLMRKNSFKLNIKIVLIIMLAIFLVVLINFNKTFQVYIVNAEEKSALEKLKKYQSGNILVLNQKCLNCLVENGNIPLAFMGNKFYVSLLSGKKIADGKGIIATTSSKHLLESEFTRDEVYQKLIQKKVKYIYLVKYDGYQEVLPFSPGDLKVGRIFNNANTEIWQLN